MLGKPAALRRFIPDTPPQPNKDRERAEIARQTAEFLARGKEIEVIEGSCAVNPTYLFGLNLSLDPDTGDVRTMQQREKRNGRTLVRIGMLARHLKTTTRYARKIATRRGFPQAIYDESPNAWWEDEVLAWVALNGGDS